MNKVKLCEHPEYARYFKMLDRGFPINNVKRIMLYDGKDPSTQTVKLISTYEYE